MRLTSAGYCIPVAKCEPLLPQNCDSRFQSAVFKYAEFSSRSYAGCGGRTRRLLRVRCGSTETPKQAGSSESPVLKKILFVRRHIRIRSRQSAPVRSGCICSRTRTIRLSVFASGGYRGIIADGVSERGGYDAAAFSRNFERFSFYGELHRRAQKIFRACENASDDDAFGI